MTSAEKTAQEFIIAASKGSPDEAIAKVFVGKMRRGVEEGESEVIILEEEDSSEEREAGCNIPSEASVVATADQCYVAQNKNSTAAEGAGIHAPAALCALVTLPMVTLLGTNNSDQQHSSGAGADSAVLHSADSADSAVSSADSGVLRGDSVDPVLVRELQSDTDHVISCQAPSVILPATVASSS